MCPVREVFLHLVFPPTFVTFSLAFALTVPRMWVTVVRSHIFGEALGENVDVDWGDIADDFQAGCGGMWECRGD